MLTEARISRLTTLAESAGLDLNSISVAPSRLRSRPDDYVVRFKLGTMPVEFFLSDLQQPGSVMVNLGAGTSLNDADRKKLVDKATKLAAKMKAQGGPKLTGMAAKVEKAAKAAGAVSVQARPSGISPGKTSVEIEFDNRGKARRFERDMAKKHPEWKSWGLSGGFDDPMLTLVV